MATTIDDALKHRFSVEGVGDFILRRPSFPDHTQITRVKLGLVGDAPSDEGGASAAYIMAVVNVLSEAKPRGFTWDGQYEWDPWLNFIDEYHRWVSSFRPNVTGSQSQIPSPMVDTGGSA